ncbi:MAG: diguanylate cyclase [Planctomycetes bacterium]|nr:diguanylate cyclase [Planctomycetota bacterium]
MTESITSNPETPVSTVVLPGNELPGTNLPVTRPAPLEASPEVSTRRVTTQNRVAEISSLLNALEEAASESGLSARQPEELITEKNHPGHLLSEGRLGMVNSLLKALRYKHPHTAAHSLRVALACSAWAEHVALEDKTRDTLEFAALMHDIGKIGASESILLNPGRLTSKELASIEQFREIGLDILSSCCGDEQVLEAVRYVGVHYDCQDGKFPLQGASIPLVSRMITIVDAFDAMTTDQVNRPAKSHERALHELFELAGMQFDPGLVKQFVESLEKNQSTLSDQVTNRWLGKVAEQVLPWSAPTVPVAKIAPTAGPIESNPSRSRFEEKLIDAMHDGVVFVDAQARITLWSKGTERLTGINCEAATGRAFAPSLLDMCTQADYRIADDACPVAKSLINNTQLRQRLLVKGRQGHHVAIDLHTIPVHSPEGKVLGATVLLHDAQPEASLEEKCEALHAEVTKDPMTKIANRAEFDRMLALFIEAHQQAGQPCSLIMCDIDHFKNINDTYGHQAGDEAIISLANLLSSLCRAGDLVARYGGEEFAVLCADCTNADGARRAEQIRRKLSELQHSCLGNKRITASFGVTEQQAGDTPETMLRRSDRALLQAKEQGRNQVVQLGNGMEKIVKKNPWWKFASLRVQSVVETSLTSAVPIDIAIEKLRGFVSDHQAKIISTRENSVELEVSSEKVSYDRRQGDHHVIFRVEMQFSEVRVERSNSLGFAAGEYAHTKVDLKIRPKRSKRGRKSDMAERARLIQQSIKAYLMAKESDEAKAEFVPTVAR